MRSLTADTNHRPGYHLRIHVDVGSGHGVQSAVSSPPCIAGTGSAQGPTLEVRRIKHEFRRRLGQPASNVRYAYLVRIMITGTLAVAVLGL